MPLPETQCSAHLFCRCAAFPRQYGENRGPTKQVPATLALRLQAKLAVRAEAHQFQTGGFRLSVDENQVGLEMAIAKIVPCS